MKSLLNKLHRRLRSTAGARSLQAYLTGRRTQRLLRLAESIKTPPTCLLVLGMHRSGTSCLAGMLGACGVFLGDVSTKNAYNHKGTQEGRATELNNGLLREASADWQAPFDVPTVSDAQQAQIQQFKQCMMAEAYEGQHKVWGIKDPRMLFCSRHWGLGDAKRIGIFRHPGKVSRSLLARKKATLTLRRDPNDIWLEYNQALLNEYKNSPFPILDFDSPLQDFIDHVNSFARSLGLKEKAQEFVDPKLVHQTETPDYVPKLVLEVYEKLKSVATD